MIKEIKINGWNNKILDHGNVKYPQSNDLNAPKNYFVSLFVGARGSGKTFLLSKLLKTLEEKKIYFNGKQMEQRIILISTTAHSDSNKVFKNLKHLDWENDVIDSYSDNLLNEKMDEVKNDLEDAKTFQEYKKIYSKFLKVDDNLNEMKPNELMLLYKYDFAHPSEIEEKIKYPYGFILHIIIDDMLGTNIFKNGKSAFTNLCIRNRHIVPCNIIIATQSVMMIPKTIRLNANLIVLFKFANKKNVLEDLYPIVSAYVTEDEFDEVYEYATSEPHDALVIDGTNGKIIFKKNFDHLLSFS